MFIHLHLLHQSVWEVEGEAWTIEHWFCLVDDAMVRGREDDDDRVPTTLNFGNVIHPFAFPFAFLFAKLISANEQSNETTHLLLTYPPVYHIIRLTVIRLQNLLFGN